MADEPLLTPMHLLAELAQLLPVVAAAGGAWWLFGVTRKRQDVHDAQRLELERSSSQGRLWRAESRVWVDGLRDAMERQFSRWNLTPEERRVALVLLSGLERDELATALGAEARVARALERSIYAKSRVVGRAAFAAYFLNDLSAPIDGGLADADFGPRRTWQGGGLRTLQ